MHPFHGRAGPLRSLNRARIGALPPGLDETDVLGKSGFQLATGWALAHDIEPQAEALGLDPHSPDLARGLDDLLRDPQIEETRRRRAEAIARRFGRRLGCLLLALKLGAPETRAARPDWGVDQWAYWAALRRIVVGGGLLSGRIGEVALPAAQAVLNAHGAADLVIARSSYGAQMALVGLARHAPMPPDTRFVFDFGQTSIKRGAAHFGAHGVTALDVESPLETVCPPLAETPLDRDDAARQWMRMLTVIAHTVEAAPTPPGPTLDVSVCLACYLFDGHPSADDVGCYGRLSLLAPNLTVWMHAQLEQRLARPVRLQLLHDGAAAAHAVDGGADTLVLTIGTALGNGFPDLNRALTPLADGFEIRPRPRSQSSLEVE